MQSAGRCALSLLNRPDAVYLLELLDERLLLAHSIFDFDSKKDGPEADEHFRDSLVRHFFIMVCMQRKNYMPLALRNLLDREWRRVFMPELHALLEKCRPWLTEEMVERAANAVFRLLTEGHHQKDQTVRNGRIIFSLKNDTESIVNNAPAITYARFSSKIVPADLLATAEYLAALIEKVSETPPPAPIMPKQKKQPKKNAASKAPTKTPKNAARVSYSFKIFEERNDKHCTITSEALPLAYQDVDQLPGRGGRDCDIERCNGKWLDRADCELVQLACGHSAHQGCLRAQRTCPCTKFIDRKVWQLTEDYSFSVISSNGDDKIEEEDRDGVGDHDGDGEALLAAGTGAPIPVPDLESRLKRTATKLANLAAKLDWRPQPAEPQSEPPPPKA